MQRYNKMPLIKKETSIHHKTGKQKSTTPFRSLPGIRDYEPQFVDPQYQ